VTKADIAAIISTAKATERQRIINLITEYSNGETLISVDVILALINNQ
jgi:hypothetical protein